MPTGTILLWPGEVTLPDGTASNAFAQAQVAKSTGTAPTNGPVLHFTELLFDGTTQEHVFFGFRMPQDYSSGGTAKIQWKRASGTGAADVVWLCCLAALTPGAAEVPNSKSLPAPDSATTAAGTTSQALVETSIALSATALNSVAAGDYVLLMLGRDADAAADTLNAVDVQVVTAAIEYTTT